MESFTFPLALSSRIISWVNGLPAGRGGRAAVLFVRRTWRPHRKDPGLGEAEYRMSKDRSNVCLIGLLLLTVSVCWAGQASSLSREDENAIGAVVQAYRNAWLNGEPEAVIATFTPDAVLQPSGLRPIVGEEAIRSFWWPSDGPATKVLAMELQVDEVGGEGKFAFVRGRGSLTFSYEQDGVVKTVSASSTFLNILRKGTDGSWKISHRMWNDLPTD